MSVVDDLKNTFRKSDNSSNRSESRPKRSRNNSDNGFSSGSGSQDSGLDSMNDGNLGVNSGNVRNSESGDFNRHGNDQLSENLGRGQQSQNPIGGQNAQQRQSQDNLPNAQAGRPEQGSSQPQVSGQTQRKMENAGFRKDNSRQQQTRQGGGRDSDLQELKSQNEQIIDLLKRINRNLEQLGR
ncbi:MAG: hypothetical protein BRC29_04160 [Nanohaloarchaea archaeon SW_7_43_1]|nr:MAG: hypothetical protein BRC29_04160 [Nanohaloarchaea archaeon SW_7_43_1]